VDPAEEGRGIGRALLSSVLSDLRRAGWARARLSTQPGSRAERFYRRAGWLDAGIAADGDLILETAL
jgi:GNAT superfamily N-acetyltransferase